MLLKDRIALLVRLGQYMQTTEEAWLQAQRKAFGENNWFTSEFVTLAVNRITTQYLQEAPLTALAHKYHLPGENPAPKKIGIVMAGNIPLVGFHDLLCVFLTGHHAFIKPSSKDEAMIKHLVEKLTEWSPESETYFVIGTIIKGCDAYIATGSNNSARYFEQYFGKFPNIIRKNRTSVAILTGDESKEYLEKLSDDIHEYFGLGCRNVTKLYVPQGYDFIPLLDSFNKYYSFINHNKYKNNYDYQLAMHILNNKYYMTNGSTLLIEDPALFSAISQVHYEYYTDLNQLNEQLKGREDIQCIVGQQHLPFGQAQCPTIDTFADGVDTLEFLRNLNR